jgi:hypothetical protein
LGALAVTVATAVVLGIAASAGATGAPAVIVTGTACTLAGSDANGNQIDGGVGVVTMKVENGNNAVLKCNAPAGTLVNLSGRTQTYKGFQCFIRSPVTFTRLETFDTNATVTADGGGEVTCRYSKL